MEPSDPFDLCGVTIDNKYRVASVVGDGGFGVVYRGVHKGFGETIAIKCLKLPVELDEEGKTELLEKLQDEGRILHRLSKATSGIVQALDVGAMTTPSGQWVPYLILEWLEGQTLAEYLKARIDSGQCGMPLQKAIALLDPVARALASAHAQKVAHRDVKPANIFLAEVAGAQTAKVLDFGIAKVLSDHRGYTTALESTAQTPAAFTPRYGAPEQFNKQRGATGPWTDVFALALVFVECVSGRKALEGDDPTQLYIASADPNFRPTLESRGVDAAAEIEDVLMRALEIEPKRRYDDAGSFWNDLRAAAGIEGGESLPTGGLRNSVPQRENAAMAPTQTAASVAARSAERGERGPTLPVESLRKPKRERNADPMAETPEGEREKRRKQPESEKGSNGPGALSVIASILALAIFVAGGLFAYSTFTQSADPDRSATPSATAASNNKRPKSHASAKPPASATPEASGDPAPSASASSSATPAAPPPDDMIMIAGATFKLSSGEETSVVGFYLQRDEVRASDYAACENAGSCKAATKTQGLDPSDAQMWDPKCNLSRGANDHPANCVNAVQAEAYCASRGGRLPTDAEWELAARGPRARRYAWGGGAPTCDLACYGRNNSCALPSREVASCPVGSFGDDRTEEGIRGLSGNVSEWTSTGGANRIVRGGSFFDEEDALLATHRATRVASSAHPTVGFRCAMDVAAP